MKQLLFTSFTAIFGVYALGLLGVLEMDESAHHKQQFLTKNTVTQPVAPSSFTKRVTLKNGKTITNHPTKRYTLKAMR